MCVCVCVCVQKTQFKLSYVYHLSTNNLKQEDDTSKQKTIRKLTKENLQLRGKRQVIK